MLFPQCGRSEFNQAAEADSPGAKLLMEKDKILSDIKPCYYINTEPVDYKIHLKNKKNKIGRNEKCPCGSGKKYKKCCLNN